MIAPNCIQKSASNISSSTNRRSAAFSRSSSVLSNRPDILLHFSSHHTVSVGFISSTQPRHIASLPAIDLCNLRSSCAAEEVFRLYATPIQRIIHLLGGSGVFLHSSTTSTNQSQQRFIVLHDQGIYVNRYWKLAIMRLLQDVCGATMVSFNCSVHMMPFAILSPPLKDVPFPSVVLSVYISGTEAQCMILADTNTLEYTYQSCQFDNVPASSESVVTTIGDLQRLQEEWLQNEQSCSLVRAIALCLEKSPMQLRKEAIHNIYFAGIILAEGFKQKVAILLYKFLTGGHPSETISKSLSSEDEPIERELSSPRSVLSDFTELPINCKLLRPLADHIALIHCDVPSELAPWFGACVWINFCRIHELESGNPAEKMQWIDVTCLSAPWKV